MEPPLPAEVIKEVEQLMARLEGQLITISFQLYGADFNQAVDTTRTLGQWVKSFDVRIKNELRKARQRLQCCQLEYRQPITQRGQWRMYWITAGVILLLVVIYISIPVVEEQATLPE